MTEQEQSTTQTTTLLEEMAPLNEDEAAAQLKVRPSTLAKWRERRVGPKYIKLGGSGYIRYRPEDLRKFVEESCVDPATRPRKKRRRGSARTRRGAR